MRSRSATVLDGLYRWRWWTGAVLSAAFVLVGDERGSLLSWVLVAVAVILLWAPVLLRWVANLCGSIASFREGLHGK